MSGSLVVLISSLGRSDGVNEDSAGGVRGAEEKGESASKLGKRTDAAASSKPMLAGVSKLGVREASR